MPSLADSELILVAGRAGVVRSHSPGRLVALGHALSDGDHSFTGRRRDVVCLQRRGMKPGRLAAALDGTPDPFVRKSPLSDRNFPLLVVGSRELEHPLREAAASLEAARIQTYGTGFRDQNRLPDCCQARDVVVPSSHHADKSRGRIKGEAPQPCARAIGCRSVGARRDFGDRERGRAIPVSDEAARATASCEPARFLRRPGWTGEPLRADSSDAAANALRAAMAAPR